MRIYIAHPYTGDEAKNRERALKAEAVLRRATPHAEFYNPVGRLSASKQFDGLSYPEVMAHCLEALADCDGIVFCGDWATSPGCRVEMQVARKLEMPRWYGVDVYVQNWACIAKATREEEALA